MTTNASQSCPQCGATIPEGSADGLCPRCVFAKAMAPTADGGTVPHVPPSLESVRAAFPHLEVTALIGSGGMGAVFKARQPQLDRFVALKILPTELADQPGFSERFQREAQALAKLSHPHIVTIYDFGHAGGFYFLLMEFIDGVNLRQLLKAKRLTPKEALSIVPPICEALQCAHDHGIVHRDIKPENLLIDRAGVVKIADFGIAKIIAASSAETAGETTGASSSAATLAFGTPDYAAPEQRDASATTDHRADIYSLGVVLYEMLTGERPKEKIEAPSKRVQVDVRIDEIVLRALEVKPELRFATATEFRTQVEAATLAAHIPPPSGAWFPLRRVSAALTATAFFAGFIPLFFVLDFGFPIGNPGIAALGTMLIGLPIIMLGVHAWCARAATAASPDQRRQVRRVFLVGATVAGILAAVGVAAGVFFLLALLEERGGWNPAPDEAVVVPLAWIAMLALSWAAAVLFRTGGRMPDGATEPSQDRIDETARNSDNPPRFSRAAIIGACWVPMTLFSFVAVAIATYQVRGDPATGPEWWQLAILIPALILGVAGPFGTTILGWVAVAQIRRSAGRIHGLQLALFDGLVFPLMTLSGVIALAGVAMAKMFVDFYLNPSLMGHPNIDPPLHPKVAFWLSQNTGLAALLLIIAIVAANIFIVRAVMRAVRK